MSKENGPGAKGRKAARTVGRKAVSGQFVTRPASGLAGGEFFARTTLKRAGGSLVMTVPASARAALHLKAGQELAVAIEGGRLVLEPAKPVRPRYSLDELIARCELDAPYPDQAREWIDAPPVGRELL